MRGRALESMLYDICHAVRVLWKSPGYTTAATLTLALGIGVNLAVFTVMHAALLASLPARHASELAQIYTWSPEGGDHFDFSYPLYVDLRGRQQPPSGLLAYTSAPVGVTAAG